MTFEIHPNKEFVGIYHDRPFQGQVPKEAKIIFLGSDANYSPAISNNDFFKYILEYQKDGVAFWKKYKCHHPFLLPNYPTGKGFDKRKDGVPYHRNFRKLGLQPPPKYAAHISFLELLDVPTIGNKSQNINQFDKMLSLKHLLYIDKLIKGGGKKLFYVSPGVLKDIKRIKNIYSSNDLFDWVRKFTVGSNNQCTTRNHIKLREMSTKINGNKVNYHRPCRWLLIKTTTPDNVIRYRPSTS